MSDDGLDDACQVKARCRRSAVPSMDSAFSCPILYSELHVAPEPSWVHDLRHARGNFRLQFVQVWSQRRASSTHDTKHTNDIVVVSDLCLTERKTGGLHAPLQRCSAYSKLTAIHSHYAQWTH